MAGLAATIKLPVGKINSLLPEVRSASWKTPRTWSSRDKPTLDDFLLLFFSPSERGQAAGRAFWNCQAPEGDSDRSEGDLDARRPRRRAEAADITGRSCAGEIAGWRA